MFAARTLVPKLLHRSQYFSIRLSYIHNESGSVRKASDTSTKINEDIIEQFEQNGVVCLRGYFNKYWIEKVRDGISKMLKEPSQYADKIKSEKGIYFNDYFQWRNITEFSEYVRHSPAANIAATFLGTEVVTFYHEHVFVKESFNETETPFHQDQAYYPVNGLQACSIWMPVTPVEEKACLKFVRGSHKWGKMFSPRYFETSENYVVVENNSDKQEYHTIPEISEKNYDLLSWHLEPGDCLVFHMRSVHGNYGSTSSKDRQTIATRWFGDDATLARRPWTTSPPILPDDIKYGEHVKNSKLFEKFPKTWK